MRLKNLIFLLADSIIDCYFTSPFEIQKINDFSIEPFLILYLQVTDWLRPEVSKIIELVNNLIS